MRGVVTSRQRHCQVEKIARELRVAARSAINLGNRAGIACGKRPGRVSQGGGHVRQRSGWWRRRETETEHRQRDAGEAKKNAQQVARIKNACFPVRIFFHNDCLFCLLGLRLMF